jgi:hypothetical protein
VAHIGYASTRYDKHDAVVKFHFKAEPDLSLKCATGESEMPVNKAFLNHGIFLEWTPIIGLRRYADYKQPLPPNPGPAALVGKFIEALKDMRIASVWIQLFSRNGSLDTDGKGGTRELVDGLKAAGIQMAGWGYCHSKHSVRDLDLAKQLCSKYGIEAFVADVEPGNEVNGKKDEWNSGDFVTLMKGLNTTFKKDNLGISTFAHLGLHKDAATLLKLATDLVCMYAPQIYWNKRAPISYAQDSIASWPKAGITTPLVATVQSYWELSEGTPGKVSIEGKVSKFVKEFPDPEWSKLIGLNWYHAGNENTKSKGGMSDPMIATIAGGRLDQKPYRPP